MKSVSVRIRSTTSRVPFRAGTYIATLEEEGGDYLTLGTTCFRRVLGIEGARA